MKELKKTIMEAAEMLRRAGVNDPETGVILGSGLNDYADRIEDALVIPYDEIPGFHAGKAQSHRGQLVYGTHMGKKIVVLAGRFHYYECNDMDITAFPTRVLVELGIKRLIITNASGCINADFGSPRLMVISDHINMSGSNPLIGPNLDEYGPRFPDMTYTYDPELRRLLMTGAEEEGIHMCEGVYVMMTGPSFETPAEIRFLRTIGADAVGMSSVPEAIIASHAGIEIIGVSFLANMAAGMTGDKLSGEEVAEGGGRIKDDFSKVVDLAISI